MRITICQLRNDPDEFQSDWDALATHCRDHDSRLVLLPEMPFYPWPCWTDQVDPAVWEASVASHDEMQTRLSEVGPAMVVGSRPVLRDGVPFNEGFAWTSDGGYVPVHTKCYLPNEPGFWEATWYERSSSGDFTIAPTEHTPIGMMICTDMWFTRHARAYGRNGAGLIAVPRATELATRAKWLSGGVAAAVVAGGYCVSSNRFGLDATGITWGGSGWVIDPDGAVIATTSEEAPFVTTDIDLSVAEEAKSTYPRYVED